MARAATLRAAPVRVRVPASSANLGPGFDALGLALSLYDDVVVQVTDEAGVHVDVAGEGADDVARDEHNLVARALLATLARLGAAPRGLRLVCANRIPHGRGLGSSAAAIVAGITAGRALVPDAASRMDDAAAVAVAAEIEGHPDNVAACLYGGLTVAWRAGDTDRAVPLAVDPALRPVALVPPEPASTAQARQLLPASVPHGDAARNSGRTALLVEALRGRLDLLLDATEDRLHQHYRQPAMPATLDLVERLRAGGLAAVVSGAGPTVLVLGDDATAQAALAAVPVGWQGLVLEVAGGATTVPLG